MSFRIPRVVRACLPVGAGFLLAITPLLNASPVWAAPSPSGSSSTSERQLTIDDVLRLHAAGLSDNIIASEILVTRTVFELTPDDLIRLKAAGLSEELIQFLVDTGLDEADRADGEPPADAESYEDGLLEYDGEAYAGDWTNEIEEEPGPTYFVTLNYNYSDWWYDSYWSDYWYYDHHYYPYASSYCWTYGAWYPGWYSYRYCYLPPYWGYRSHWYASWGYRWDVDSCWDYYPSGGTYTADYRHTYPLSETKYKTTGRSSGKRLYADAGLKVRDVDRLTRTRTRVDRKVIRGQKDRLVLADARGPGGDRIHRPVKTNSLTGATKRPVTLGKPVRLDDRSRVHVDRTRTRSTRRPALDKPPKPRVRTTHTVDKPRSPVRTEQPAVEKPRVDDRRKPSSVTRSTRRPDPPAVDRSKPKPVEKPAVQKRSKPKKSPPPTPPRTPEVSRPAPSSPPPQASPPPRPAPKPKPAPAKQPPRAQQKSRGKPRR